MNLVYLLIGGNMGDRLAWLKRARTAIKASAGGIVRASSIYETEAWGLNNQASFLNQALEISTPLEPVPLLNTLLSIENTLGRHREVKYGPRTIDIDILFFNHQIIDLPELTIPHPQIPFRRFALAPLAEIAPEWPHPVINKTISQLLADCTDPLAVNKIN